MLTYPHYHDALTHDETQLLRHICRINGRESTQYKWDSGEADVETLCIALFGSLKIAAQWFKEFRKRDKNYCDSILLDIRNTPNPVVIIDYKLGTPLCLYGEITLGAAAFSGLETVPACIGIYSPIKNRKRNPNIHGAISPQIYRDLDSGRVELPEIKWSKPTDSELENEIRTEHSIEEIVVPLAERSLKSPQASKYVDTLRSLCEVKRIPREKLRGIADFSSFVGLWETVTSYGGPKDPDSMIDKIFDGKPLPMPIVIKEDDYKIRGSLSRGGDAYFVLGGNTRSYLAILSHQDPVCYAINSDKLKAYREKDAMADLRRKIDENPGGEEAYLDASLYYLDGKAPELLREYSWFTALTVYHATAHLIRSQGISVPIPVEMSLWELWRAANGDK